MIDSQDEHRSTGALVGAIVSALATGACFWLDWPFTPLVAIGIPSGASVGFVMAPRVIAATSIGRPVIESAVVAVLVTTIAVVALGAISTGSPTFVYLLLLPFILFGAFAIGLPVALPVGFIGAWVLRRVVARSRRPASSIGTVKPGSTHHR